MMLLVFAAGCTTNAPACEDDGNCAEGQACLQGTCTEVECLTSSDCDVEHYCGQAHACQTGCSEDQDCRAGEVCAGSHECAAYGCRSTQLDCDYGQVCDTSTGKCEDALGESCSSCDAGASATCGSASDCLVWNTGDACNNDGDCPDGWQCDNFGAPYGTLCHTDYCFTTCDPSQGSEACPRGYECQDVMGDGSHLCFADCDWLAAQGG